ncbi:hypothetical protein E2I00_017270, partial [Balaenoptera physalus]
SHNLDTAERHKTELRPLEEDPAEGHASQGADLHGGTVVSRTTPLGRVPGHPARTPSWCSIPGHPPGRRPPRVTTVGPRCCTGAAPTLRCARSARTALRAHIPVPGPCRRPLPQSPFVELPAAGRHSEACTRMSPLAPQELMKAAEEPLPCARCGKCLGPNEQRMGRGPPDASGPFPREPGRPVQQLYAYVECGKAFTCTSKLLQPEGIHTGQRPYVR